MIVLPTLLGVTLSQVLAASDSVPARTVQSAPYASRISAALDLLDRAAALMNRRGQVKITSLMRSEARNASLDDASRYSHHLTGYAVDFVVPNVDHGIVYEALKPFAAQLGYDELAVYDDHVHLSADPRRRGKNLDFRTAATKPPAGASPSPARSGTATLAPLVVLLLIVGVLVWMGAAK